MPQKKTKTADEIIAEARAAYKSSGGGKMAPAPVSAPKPAAPKAPAQKSMSDQLTDQAIGMQQKRDKLLKPKETPGPGKKRPHGSPYAQGIHPDCVTYRRMS